MMVGARLMPVYYRQRRHRDEHGAFAVSLADLGLAAGRLPAWPGVDGRTVDLPAAWSLELNGDGETFRAALLTPDGTATVEYDTEAFKEPPAYLVTNNSADQLVFAARNGTFHDLWRLTKDGAFFEVKIPQDKKVTVLATAADTSSSASATWVSRRTGTDSTLSELASALAAINRSSTRCWRSPAWRPRRRC